MANPEKPRSEAEVALSSRPVTRRQVLGGMAGVAGLAAVPALIAACGPSGTTTTSSPGSSQPAATATPAGSQPAAGGGEVTFGSNASDAVPKAAFEEVFAAFKAASGIDVKVNTVDHGTFQDQISSYLQGAPDDVFTWFAGFRARFFYSQGLAGDVSDVWSTIGSNYSDAFKAASTADDGKQIFVPFYNYPWVVLYRKSVFQEKSYTIPKTLDEFKALGTKMKADGLVPLAFGDKDGWPAMGTFDILNMRQNGYKFHIGLMAGTEKWTDPRVKTVYETWKTILPHFQEAALGRTWQEAAQAMVGKTAGMYFLGTFAAQQAQTDEDKADLDFFPFPVLGTEFDSELGIDAPIDGFMLSNAKKNPEGAKALLEFLGTGAAQTIYVTADPSNVAAANDADKSSYTEFQKKSAEIIAGSGAIAQFLDRDTRPDFAGPNGMQGFIQQFLTDPEQNLDTHLKSIQDFWDTLV
jgi:multiple sugar transport system substrate-binding protein